MRYGEGTGGFYDYLYQMYGEFGNKTIWVTEYADTSLNDTGRSVRSSSIQSLNPCPAEVMDFINQTTVFMDGLDFVERYAWFGYFVSSRRFSPGATLTNILVSITETRKWLRVQ